MRTFLTLVPDVDLALEIEKWCRLCWPAHERRIPVQNYHITVVFLGETDDNALQKLADLLENFNHQSFQLHLNKVGYWPDANVLWLGTDEVPDALVEMHKVCRRTVNRLGVRGGGKRYEPHVTLAKKFSTPPASALFEPDFLFRVQSLQLWSSVRDSAGARYETLASWMLT